MKASGVNFSEGLSDRRLRESFGHPEMLPKQNSFWSHRSSEHSRDRVLAPFLETWRYVIKINAVTWQQQLDFSETSSIFTGRGSLFKTFQGFYNRGELWNTHLHRAEFLFQSGGISMGQKKVKFKEVSAQVKWEKTENNTSDSQVFKLISVLKGL